MSLRRLIINADDLGYDPSITRGILESIRDGIVSSTTLLVNTSHSAEAASLAKGCAVGLHLNLARYLPVSRHFPPSFLVDGQLSEPIAPMLPPEVVEAETLAQLDHAALLLAREPTHIDVHKHLHQHLGIRAGLAAAARGRGLPVRSLDASMRTEFQRAGVRTNDHFLGDAGVEPYWTSERLEKELNALPEGVTELMCHPGYTPQLVRTGYSRQRETELSTFTSPVARRLLEKNQIELTSFRELLLHN